MPGSKTVTQRRIVILGEWLLALVILAMLVELALIYQHSNAPLPGVKLIERTEVTVAPPKTVKLDSQTHVTGITHPTNVSGTFVIPERKRSVPPLFAFENIRRLLGLLGPENESPDVYVLTRLRTEKTLDINEPVRPVTPENTKNTLSPDSNTAIHTSAETNLILTGSEPKSRPNGQQFRISLP